MRKDAVTRKKLEERARRGLESATPERLGQIDGEFIVDENGAQLVNQSWLDQLLYAHKITWREYEAGDRLREDAYESGMVWSGTSTLREPGAGTRKDQRLPRFAN